VYNGTTCLRSSVQTNRRMLSVSFFPFFLHLSLSLSLSLYLFSLALHFHRFFVIPPSPRSSSVSLLHFSFVRIPTCLFPSCLSLFSVSIVRTTINKPLIELTPILGTLFEVNERPMVPRSPTFFNVSSFLSDYLHRLSFLAICHCRRLKSGLMTIYHFCYSRKSRSKRRHI